MKCLTFFMLIVACHCRPQNPETAAVDVEKQQVVEITPRQLYQEHKQIEDEHTKEILAKIAQVNEQHGLGKKNKRPFYHQFPFNFMRSHQPSEERQSTDFKFPRDPFTNPILEYVENLSNKKDNKASDAFNGVVVKNEIKPSQVDASDLIPGHYVKRKIVHQQSVLVPNPAYFAQFYIGPVQQDYNAFYGQVPLGQLPGQTSGKDMEKQTVENIKNIMGQQQYPPVVPYAGPYTYYQGDLEGNAGRQFQSPLGQYFPIMIKDPFMQLFNAMTSMIEYGPNAGGAGGGGSGCKKKEKKPMAKDGLEEESGEIEGKEEMIESEENENSMLSTILEIEDLKIGDNETTFRQSKNNAGVNRQNSTKTRTANPKSPTVQAIHLSKPQEDPKKENLRQASPPNRDQTLHEDEELTSEDFEDKAEDITISNEGAKKMLSKDNTGSGIFIHKLKVRKGGVAIAGPGGIATAGSGGTAIVGPNGFAYTHPDSLAIAGTGTKVISVDPSINLADIVNDHKLNKTRGSHPRVGKVVAVGPVIYYNNGA